MGFAKAQTDPRKTQRKTPTQDELKYPKIPLRKAEQVPREANILAALTFLLQFSFSHAAALDLSSSPRALQTLGLFRTETAFLPVPTQLTERSARKRSSALAVVFANAQASLGFSFAKAGGFLETKDLLGRP
jgi:hypothetical protein